MCAYSFHFFHLIYSDMASYEQVIKFENEKPQGVIRLVEANGFYWAYNQSAYYFHQAIAQHKVTRKFVKNINQEIVYVGFPVDKLLERIGERSHKKTELGYDVELSSSELPDAANYDEWRRTLSGGLRADLGSDKPQSVGKKAATAGEEVKADRLSGTKREISGKAKDRDVQK